MTDAFTGMSWGEMRGMPLTVEASINKLFPAPGRAAQIAKAQHDYVAQVYRRTPRYRWFKKRRLALALDHTALVLKLCRPNTQDGGQDAAALLTDKEHEQ